MHNLSEVKIYRTLVGYNGILRCNWVPIYNTANVAFKYLFSWTMVEMVSCVSGHAL